MSVFTELPWFNPCDSSVVIDQLIYFIIRTLESLYEQETIWTTSPSIR